jgi:hypothetical protein
MLCIIVPEYESADDEQATATENDSEPTTDEDDEPTDGDRFLRTGR